MATAVSPLLPYLGTALSSVVIQTGLLPPASAIQPGLGGAPDLYVQKLALSLWAPNDVAPIEKVIAGLVDIMRNGGAVSPTSLQAIVSTALAPYLAEEDQWKRNRAAARAKYLTLPGRRLFKQYPALLGAKAAGTYLFPRPGNDRWIPYLDPQESTVPGFIAPEGWADNEFSYEGACFIPGVILADAGQQDCQAHVDYADRLTWNWPFAWPLTNPTRVAGLWSLYADVGLEQLVANLYLLPTALHARVRMADVMQCLECLTRARSLYFPNALDTADGGIVLTAQGNFQQGQPKEKPRPEFSTFATAWRRVQDFLRMRALVDKNRLYWPLDLQMAASENTDDFK